MANAEEPNRAPPRARPRARPQPPHAGDTSPEPLLPQSVDAERAMLGSILISPDVLSAVRLIAEPNSPYVEANRLVYQAMCALADTETPPDLITVCDELQRRGDLEHIGGVAYVSALPNQVPSSDSAEHYARIVQDHWLQREIIAHAGKIAALGYHETVPTAALAAIRAQLDALERRAQKSVGDMFPIRSAEEIELVEPPAGLVGNIIQEGDLAILYADSGRWKTYLALSWACCIADGRPWLGRAVKAGHVLYVAAEGGAGIGPRITAWKRRHDVSALPKLHVLTVPVNLLQPAQIHKLIASVQALSLDEPLQLIVFDTLSRSMAGGNENAGEDGSAALGSADLLRETFGCAVLFPAHPGHTDGHIRGWSGYFQWADTVVKLAATDRRPLLKPGDVVTLSCEKPKNTEPFLDIPLTTEQESWTTADGREKHNLVIIAADGLTRAERPRAQLPASQQIAIAGIAAQPGIKRAELVAYAAPHRIGRTAIHDAVKALVQAQWATEDMHGIRLTLACPEYPEPSESGYSGRSTTQLGRPDYPGVSLDTRISGQASGEPDGKVDTPIRFLRDQVN